jgi:nucleotide-binding universal stress UspA family protein
LVETEIEHGPPAQRIVDFAEESGCDLIIIGTRGETGALQWRFGGVASKVVRAKTTMPVLVVTT